MGRCRDDVDVNFTGASTLGAVGSQLKSTATADAAATKASAATSAPTAPAASIMTIALSARAATAPADSSLGSRLISDTSSSSLTKFRCV